MKWNTNESSGNFEKFSFVQPFLGEGINMINSSSKFISQFLIVAMLAVPFQTAQAGLIGTEQIIAAQQTQGDRVRVADFLSRAEVQGQLQAMGITADAAKDRVSAMTDVEVQRLAGKIDSLPAGAASNAAVILVIVLLVWLFYTYK